MTQREWAFFPIGEYGLLARYVNVQYRASGDISAYINVSLPNGQTVYLSGLAMKFHCVAVPAYLDVYIASHSHRIIDKLELYVAHRILHYSFDAAPTHSLRLFPSGICEAKPRSTTKE